MEDKEPEKCLVIRSFQALAAPLMEGGEGYAEMCVQELKAVADDACRMARAIEEQARRVKFEDYESPVHQQRELTWAVMPDGLEREISFWSLEAQKGQGERVRQGRCMKTPFLWRYSAIT